MNILIAILSTFLLLSTIGLTNGTFSSSIKSRIRRQLGSGSRKLIEVGDPSKVLDGQYIVVFDSDIVTNVTAKVMQLFEKDQVSFKYDNVVMKGVAIRNVTTQVLTTLELDPQILFIEPVCINVEGVTRTIALYFLSSLLYFYNILKHIYS
jgi:hypothetical protein